MRPTHRTAARACGSCAGTREQDPSPPMSASRDRAGRPSLRAGCDGNHGQHGDGWFGQRPPGEWPPSTLTRTTTNAGVGRRSPPVSLVASGEALGAVGVPAVVTGRRERPGSLGGVYVHLLALVPTRALLRFSERSPGQKLKWPARRHLRGSRRRRRVDARHHRRTQASYFRSATVRATACAVTSPRPCFDSPRGLLAKAGPAPLLYERGPGVKSLACSMSDP